MLNLKVVTEEFLAWNVCVGVGCTVVVVLQFFVELIANDVIAGDMGNVELCFENVLDALVFFGVRGNGGGEALTFFGTLFQFASQLNPDFIGLSVGRNQLVDDIDQLVQNFLDHGIAQRILFERRKLLHKGLQGNFFGCKRRGRVAITSSRAGFAVDVAFFQEWQNLGNGFGAQIAVIR